MQNYKLVLQYDGTRYRGWQKQGNTKDTIQGKVESVLEKMTGEAIEVHGSGRTDAGVHANAQVANVKLPDDGRGEQEILTYLNQYLPEDIVVMSVEKVDARFHARLCAKEKTYVYRICTTQQPNVFTRKYTLHIPEKLDLLKMKDAASFLEGEHDFTSFCGNRHLKKSAVRTIYSISFTQRDGELQIRVTGNGFLQNMVRIIVGTLVEVGMGKRMQQEMESVLKAKNRDKAGVTIAAKGLSLEEVRY
ncbi:MAG: tRNA pseudouridine(38-40) synthase TruA [Lachnospiraceae bacterium]